MHRLAGLIISIFRVNLTAYHDSVKQYMDHKIIRLHKPPRCVFPTYHTARTPLYRLKTASLSVSEKDGLRPTPSQLQSGLNTTRKRFAPSPPRKWTRNGMYSTQHYFGDVNCYRDPESGTWDKKKKNRAVVLQNKQQKKPHNPWFQKWTKVQAMTGFLAFPNFLHVVIGVMKYPKSSTTTWNIWKLVPVGNELQDLDEKLSQTFPPDLALQLEFVAEGKG